jgi:hypothetical protein
VGTLPPVADIGDEGRFDEIDRWAAEARAREAADARVRERWLRAQAEEGAQMAQVLAGLAERGATVVVTTIAGRSVVGRLASVGQDFVRVATTAGSTSLVPFSALAWLREPPGDRRRPDPAVGPDPSPFADDGGPPGAAALVDLLAQAAAVRPRVTVHSNGASVTGDLRSVGIDMAVVQTDGDPPGLTYVRLASVYEISFLDSG